MLRKEIPFTCTMPVRTTGAVNITANTKQCKVFPNPTNNNVNTVLPDNKIQVSFCVFDSMGSMTNIGIINKISTTLHLKNLAQGSYILKIITDAEVYSNKLE
jgi:hypothetical protein